MDSYLIRIYRRSKDDPEEVVGVVEEIDSGQTHAFHNLSGLCLTLTAGKNKRSGKNVSTTGNEISGKQVRKKAIT